MTRVLRLRPPDVPIRLHWRGMLELHDAAGTTIANRRGILWVTQDGDPRDIVLAPGQSFTVDRDGTTLVTSMRGAAVAALSTRPASAPRAAIRRRSARTS